MELIEKTDFSNSEKSAVEFILAQRDIINDLTLSQMAKDSFASPSTFVRVAQKLGFKGWNDFKSEFLKEITYFEKEISNVDLNIPFDNTDTLISIAKKVASIKKDAIDDTIELLSVKELNHAIAILTKASEINIFASSINILLSEEFIFKMNRIQKPVSLSRLEGEHIHDVLNIRDGGVAIVVSYSGSSKKMIEIMSALVKRKVPIIAITGLTENVLTKNADSILTMATREKLYSKVGQYSTNTSISLILDILYSGAFAKNFDYNLLHTIENSKIANIRRATTKLMEE